MVHRIIRSRLLVLAVISALSIPAVSSAGEQDVISEADALYKQRASSTKSNEALELLREGATQYPDSYGIHWRLARAAWWICDGTTDNAVKKATGLEGMDAGNRAIVIKPTGLEARYWMVLALGEYSKGISILKAIGQGLDGKFTKNMDAVVRADEDYDDGGGLRAQSRYHFTMPRPMRSYPMALEKLERSDELVPDHPRTLYFLAETHHALGDDTAARTALDACLASTWPDRAERDRVHGWARSFESQLE